MTPRNRCCRTTARSITKSMKVLKASFIEMGILDQEPPDDKILTTKFLPVKP